MLQYHKNPIILGGHSEKMVPSFLLVSPPHCVDRPLSRRGLEPDIP